FPIVALVGYTNAGKSTLFNNATKAKVLAKDMLFATLDTTSRAMKTPQGRDIILSDTVGFITDLPHELIAAFRATLEEVAEADILIHVRDISGAETEAQKHDVDQILDTILKGAEPLPTIIEAWNKADLLPEAALLEAKANRNILFKRDGKVAVLTNSESGEGLDELFDEIDKELSFGAKQKSIICGANDGKMRAWLYDKGVVLREIRNDDGEVVLKVSLDKINEIKFKSQFPEAIESAIVA
ncbi:MAG: GTP-binding protein HflX, partial [Hyphomonadaceae bacterium]